MKSSGGRSPRQLLTIDEATQQAFDELMSSISSSNSNDYSKSCRQLEEDLIEIADEINASVEEQKENISLNKPVETEAAQKTIAKLYVIESNYHSSPHCVPTVSKLLHVFITTAAIAIGSFMLGALIGAAATGWAGPGVLLGAIIGGIAGLVVGPIVTSIGFFCEYKSDKPKPVNEQKISIQPEPLSYCSSTTMTATA